MLHCCGFPDEDEEIETAPSRPSLHPGTLCQMRLATHPDKGRCVMADEPIAPGSVLEIAATISLSQEDCEQIDRTVLYNYYYEYEPAGEEPVCLIVLGLTSLCNHGARPNARYGFSRTDSGIYATLTAIEDIQPGEEITVDYGVRPLWFTPQ